MIPDHIKHCLQKKNVNTNINKQNRLETKPKFCDLNIIFKVHYVLRCKKNVEIQCTVITPFQNILERALT